MYGRELIGRRLQDGKIQYTDWGNLAIEMSMAFPKEPEPWNIRSLTNQFGTSIEELLLEEIVKDIQGVVSFEEFKKLGDADLIWLIDDGKLISVKERAE